MKSHTPVTFDLPPLKTVRRKREQSVTPKVLAWFLKHYHTSVAIEVKATKGRSIAESALMPHQRQALLDAREGGIAHKIADTGRRLPFDGFVLKNTPAFVVACFTRYGVCFVVPVEKWRGARVDDPDGAQATHHIQIGS